MAFLAVSDLHIQGAEDPLFLSLLRLVRTCVGSGDTFVLAGDIFDLFIGNKRIFTERYRELLEALADASQRGAHLHYIEGNHDFLVRRAFARVPRLEVHSHEVQLEIGGRRFHVEHGDTVDREDYGYRALRLFLRSPLIRAVVLTFPGAWVEAIGNRSSTQSKRLQRNVRVLEDHRPERVERLRRVYRNHAAELMKSGFDFVVMGHCHDRDEMTFRLGARSGHYMNIGYPRVHGCYVEWRPGDEQLRRVAMPSG